MAIPILPEKVKIDDGPNWLRVPQAVADVLVAEGLIIKCDSITCNAGTYHLGGKADSFAAVERRARELEGKS